MLWQASGLKGFRVLANDGQCGKVRDFLFDDTNWHVRWIVGDIGNWIDPHEVLLPPGAFGRPQEDASLCPAALTKDKVAHGMDIVEDPPVALQMARDSSGALGLEVLAAMAAEGPFYPLLPPEDAHAGSAHASRRHDPHLRSVEEVTGYEIYANDGRLGEVDDFILDDSGWRITHLVVGWTKWWTQQRVAVPVTAVRSIDWNNKRVRVMLSLSEIKASPAYEGMDIHGRHGVAMPHIGWEHVI
jgi:sporulation protein YlmC with PRC-barrel domain